MTTDLYSVPAANGVESTTNGLTTATNPPTVDSNPTIPTINSNGIPQKLALLQSQEVKQQPAENEKVEKKEEPKEEPKIEEEEEEKKEEKKEEEKKEEPKEEEELLFSPSLITAEIQSVLPEGYSARPLRRSDFNLGYLDVLRVLTTVGDITESMWNDRYDYLLKRNDEYYLIVICDGAGKIVGTGSLIVERKFIHALGLVGHIEDIAVASDQQGKKLGLRIIQTLDHVAAQVGCYKSILDCSEINEGFYLKCGFKRAGLEMAHYY